MTDQTQQDECYTLGHAIYGRIHKRPGRISQDGKTFTVPTRYATFRPGQWARTWPEALDLAERIRAEEVAMLEERLACVREYEFVEPTEAVP